MTASPTANKPLREGGITWRDINYLHLFILTVPPLLAFYGLATIPIQLKTLAFAIFYYFVTGLGITAGYHRYWSHRSYDASRPFQVFLAMAGAGAVEGSIRWWARDHRAHHRYTDSDKDPYSANKGLFYAHMGWMLLKQQPNRIGRVDISDLNRDPLVRWQHKYYLPLALFMAGLLPTLVAGLGWGDYAGGFLFGGMARLVFVHHATFCVNSLAHYLGEQSFDDRLTPKDHFFTALVTLGEGYHNFHHEFPSDYRNAIFPWQYDPTKWLIWLSSLAGLTYNLKIFPENEVQKGRLQMQRKKIDDLLKRLKWGIPVDELPSWTFTEVQQKVKEDRKLLVVDDIVYDVESFMDDHPGGRGFLSTAIGRDVSSSFNGAIYYHSNAARNLMTHMRVAKIQDGIPDEYCAHEE